MYKTEPPRYTERTIVTAYFRTNSKHSDEEYNEWIQNFVSITDAMIIFTERELVSEYEQMRKDLPTKVYGMYLNESWPARYYDKLFWHGQELKDPQIRLHKSHQLYHIWLSKSWFVTKAIKLNPFHSSIFLWSDIGCFRDKKYNSDRFFTHTGAIPESALLLNAFRRPESAANNWFQKDMNAEFYGGLFLTGAQMAGRRQPWMEFHAAFMHTVRGYIERDLFIGEDQVIIQSTCQSHRHLCMFTVGNSNISDIWFGLKPVLNEDLITERLFLGNDDRFHSESVRSDGRLCLNENFTPNHALSVWTMLTDGGPYVSGAVKLIKSAQRATRILVDFVYLELASKPLKHNESVLLEREGWMKCVVDTIQPLDVQNTFPRFREQFTKLHVWKMTSYDTLIYLDSDTIVIGNLDDLLSSELTVPHRIGAARDFGGGRWRNTFNMGVFFIKPNTSEYERLRFIQKDPAIEFETSMSEQGFLNVVYEDMWYDIEFRNNANLAVYSQLRSYWDENFAKVNILHYTMTKPWACTLEYERPCALWHDVH